MPEHPGDESADCCLKSASKSSRVIGLRASEKSTGSTLCRIAASSSDTTRCPAKT